MRRWLLCVVAATSIVAAPGAQAFPCTPGTNPFTDIPDGIFYCTNTLWLRNANVTLGCGSGNTYCPDEFVQRSQMALFMNRLAQALIPEVRIETGGPPVGDLDAGASTCRTQVISVPPGNRRMLSLVLANLSLLTDADADIGLTLQISENGGSFASISTPTMAVHVPANKWTTASIFASTTIQLTVGSLDVDPNQTLEFRVGMSRLAGGTTGEVTSSRCQLKVDMPMHWAQN
jgi:hypothetical protein